MGTILDYNYLDLRRPFDNALEPVIFSLEKTLGKIDGKTQKISLDFAFYRDRHRNELPLYDDLSPINESLRLVDYKSEQAYKEGNFAHRSIRNDERKKISLLLNDPNISDKQKSDIEHMLNIVMFVDKYKRTDFAQGTKKQEDYVISIFKPWLDFTKPLTQRVSMFLELMLRTYSYDETLKKLDKANLAVDVMPNGEEHRYGDDWLQRTLDPADMRSFVDSWNSICVLRKRIELINCPIINHSDKTVKSLLDLGDDFYDNLRAKDYKSIAIEEI